MGHFASIVNLLYTPHLRLDGCCVQSAMVWWQKCNWLVGRTKRTEVPFLLLLLQDRSTLGDGKIMTGLVLLEVGWGAGGGAHWANTGS